jgi:hypothetical protein
MTNIDSSLTKGVLNLPPRDIPKHVSGDTDVNQTAREENNSAFYTVLSPFLLIKDIPFGLVGGWDL